MFRMWQALHHMRLAQKEPSKRAKGELLHKAKMCLTHRRRLESSNTKATNTMFLLRQQIDSIVSTHSDTLVIDAMRQFSMVATKLGLPDRAAEVLELNDDLHEHHSEIQELEQALKIGLSMGSVQEDEDEDLQTELDHLLNEPEAEFTPKDAKTKVESESTKVAKTKVETEAEFTVKAAKTEAKATKVDEEKRKSNKEPCLEEELGRLCAYIA